MPGVRDTQVYSGPEGTVRKAEASYFTQFHAVRQTPRGPKSRIFNTQAGAIKWLKKMAAALTPNQQ